MQIISVISLWFIPVLIGFILLYGTFKKVPTYETFVEGGKEGIKMSINHSFFSRNDGGNCCF